MNKLFSFRFFPLWPHILDLVSRHHGVSSVLTSWESSGLDPCSSKSRQSTHSRLLKWSHSLAVIVAESVIVSSLFHLRATLTDMTPHFSCFRERYKYANMRSVSKLEWMVNYACFGLLSTHKVQLNYVTECMHCLFSGFTMKRIETSFQRPACIRKHSESKRSVENVRVNMSLCQLAIVQGVPPPKSHSCRDRLQSLNIPYNNT